MSPSSDDQFRRLGFEPGDIEPDRVCVWPDNADAVHLFDAMQTQWRVSANGIAIGLHYEALPVVCQALGIPRRRRSRVFQELRIMELAALAELQRPAD